MQNLKIVDYFSSNLQIEKTAFSSLLEHFTVRTFKKNEFLLREDEFCKHSFFVESGLLRQYSIDEKGKEHTIAFVPENWFVSDRESVYFESPSKYYIQALEDSQVVLVDEKLINVLSETIPSYTAFNDKLLHNHIRHLQNRINMLLSASAKQRYIAFILMHPDILLRVPQTMVASYLGITAESLSRVRKDLAKENFKK